MQKALRRLAPLSVAVAVGLSLIAVGPPAAGAPPADSPSAGAPGQQRDLRPVEYLTRGLVAAQVPGGTVLSWRLL